MSKKFPIDEAQLVGMFMESVFYGCLKVLTWVDGRLKKWSKINLMMLIAAILMFIFGSLDVAFHLRHNLDAFINNGDEDPIAEFQETSNWINVMKMACYVAQTFIGDCILLYRCWIVYNRSWLVVLLPTLLWLGTTASGVMTIFYEATLKENDKLLMSNKIVPFITSMLTLTLAMNVLTTSLMVYRIRKIRNRLKHRAVTLTSTTNPLDNVTRLLVESGLMYTVSIIILFGMYMAGHNGQYGVSNSVVQIIGITFNLIITSIDRGDATTPSPPISSQGVFSHQSGTGNTNVPLHLISIQTSVSRYPDTSNTSPLSGGKSPMELDRDSEIRGSIKSESGWNHAV